MRLVKIMEDFTSIFTALREAVGPATSAVLLQAICSWWMGELPVGSGVALSEVEELRSVGKVNLSGLEYGLTPKNALLGTISPRRGSTH